MLWEVFLKLASKTISQTCLFPSPQYESPVHTCFYYCPWMDTEHSTSQHSALEGIMV